jgi:hypothetical protein
LPDMFRNWMDKLICVAIHEGQYYPSHKSWLIYFC